ncbi:probable BOI-related E3 ubiquitin-protein ligase 3 [Phalaenopsis equestris]|uniref:probable BOI-related E3 ubiquitin-protein ligase 3 n=1 Tax=Phalaenopsis equestris TaxID=78828 RepID=UPI0009E5480A|nr:probable BOI-related E3 ubiquitin-protein ligase 3 [Phalaenopsis equestris]
MAWQAKAMAEHAAAVSLHSQLQKAAVEAAAGAAPPSLKDHCGESPAEDAESAYVDPNRFDKPDRPCRACDRRPAVVVLLPCCHLSLCVSCDFVSSVGDPCPACGIFRTGSLQVSFA